MTHRETHTSTNAVHAAKSARSDESFHGVLSLKKSSFGENKNENQPAERSLVLFPERNVSLGSFVGFLHLYLKTSGSKSRFGSV